MRLTLALLTFLAWTGVAQAQFAVSGAQACPAGQFVTGFAANSSIICAVPPSSGGSTTITAGPGIAVGGSASAGYTVSGNWGIQDVTVGRSIVTTDNWTTLNYTPTVAGTLGTFTLPVAGSAGFGQNFAFDILATDGPVAFTGATFHGGPAQLDQGQGVSFQSDNGKWIVSGAPSAVKNPHPFQ